MSVTYAYLGEITKTDKTPDGDLVVYGKATGPDLDLDEQRCDPAWLKTAMPGWAEWGNIREQHTAIAAGVGIETAQSGDDWFVKSLITDPTTAHKVETKTLKGYSIGIKNARVVKDASAPGGRIVGGDIVEISLVDRPCNPTATMALAKAAGGAMAPVDVAGGLVMDLSKARIIDGTLAETSKVKAAPARAAGVLSKRKRAEAWQLAKGILDEERTAPVLTKGATGYDESADIAGALDVIAKISALICSEAKSLGTGRMEEAYDISCLMDAVSAMKCFLAREQSQDGGGGKGTDVDGMSYVQLAADAKAAKAAKKAKRLGKNAKTAHTGDSGQESNASSKAAKTDVIKTAVAEVSAAYEERIKALEADLAKVLSTPIPGGPLLVTPLTQRPTANPALQKAERLRAIAAQASDPGVAGDYLALAAREEGAPIT